MRRSWGRSDIECDADDVGHNVPLYTDQFGGRFRMTSWPAIRTNGASHHQYEMGHAASIGLAIVLIGLPLLGLSVSWMIETSDTASYDGLSLYGFAQMLAYSPLLSWLGLAIGVPLVHWSIRWGFGGWLVTIAIGAICGAIVLNGAAWTTLDVVSIRIGLIGALFGGAFSAIYWLVMRLLSPVLFQAPE